MNREEIIKKIEELEEMLYETDEEQEQLEEYRKQARLGAKMFNVMLEEYAKEGFDREFAIELVKLAIGGNK